MVLVGVRSGGFAFGHPAKSQRRAGVGRRGDRRTMLGIVMTKKTFAATLIFPVVFILLRNDRTQTFLITVLAALFGLWVVTATLGLCYWQGYAADLLAVTGSAEHRRRGSLRRRPRASDRASMPSTARFPWEIRGPGPSFPMWGPACATENVWRPGGWQRPPTWRPPTT